MQAFLTNSHDDNRENERRIRSIVYDFFRKYIEIIYDFLYDVDMENNNRTLNKKQIAYEHLHRLIVDGTYGSGQRIIIDQTAKELGLSSIPVREAIRQLESEGFIEYKPYSGAVVTSINEDEYIETLSVLSLLEGYATALSSLTLGGSDLENLVNLNKDMEKALHNFELELFGKLNQRFHTTIFDGQGEKVHFHISSAAGNRVHSRTRQNHPASKRSGAF